MNLALKFNESPLRIVKPGEESDEQVTKVVSFNIFRILKKIDDEINYYLYPSYIKILTDEQRHKILQNLAGNEDIFKKLTDKEKLKILERLFIGDEENLKNLSDTEKLGIFDKLLEGNKEKKVEKLSNKEKNKILYDLFLGEEGKLDSAFLYKGNGAYLYAEISRDKSYPFIKIENDYLKYLKKNKKFRKILEKCEYVTDVGCGDGQKAISLLEGTHRKGTYIPEDFSRDMLDLARENIEEYASEINLGPSLKLENGKKNLSREFKNNMYLFLGGTICNMSDEQIIDELKNMDNKGIITGNKILLSYFTTPNSIDEVKNLIEIYNSKNNIAFHENGMDMLGLSKDDFEYDTIYELDNGTKLKLENGELKPYEGTLNDLLKGPFSGKIKGIIRAKRDLELNLNSGWKKKIKMGDEFTLHYSRRFTKEKIEDLFRKSGCNVELSFDSQGDSITLLKRAPTKRKALIDKIKNVLYGVIIGAVGVMGSNYYTTYQKNKEIQNKVIDRSFKKDIGKGINYTLESQASKELLTAIGLSNADNETKKAINSSFNHYVKYYEKDSLSTEDLITAFRNDMGGTYIYEYGATNPYDFITKELIDNTNYAAHEGKAYKEYNEFNTKNYESSKRECDFFEYDDNGEKYHMLKAYIGKKPVYLASKENNGIITYSTNNVENIRNKEGLNKAILANNHKLETNIITRAIMRKNGDIDKLNILLLYEDCVDFRDSDTYTLYLNGKKYYLKIGKTLSGYEVLGASKSSAGPFSVKFFDKEISQEFKLSPYRRRIPENYEQRRKGTVYGSSHGMGGNPFASDKLEKPDSN